MTFRPTSRHRCSRSATDHTGVSGSKAAATSGSPLFDLMVSTSRKYETSFNLYFGKLLFATMTCQLTCRKVVTSSAATSASE
jgi:hypothetical protein